MEHTKTLYRHETTLKLFSVTKFFIGVQETWQRRLKTLEKKRTEPNRKYSNRNR